MLYFKARWLRDGTSVDPVELISELDESRDEIRRVDIFADGRMETASKDTETGSTFLSLVPIPSLDEINSQAEFEAVEITRNEFEVVWSRAVGTSRTEHSRPISRRRPIRR